MKVKTKSPLKKSIIINLSDEEILRRVDQIEALSCDNDLRQFLIDALQTLVELDRLVGLKNTTINRLRKIFNKETEKNSSKEKNQDNKAKGSGRGNNNGRNGKKDYPLAPTCTHKHSTLNDGDKCPECGKGTLTPYTPGVHIRITGNPPLSATVHETEKFRCNACLKIYEADFEGKDAPKYDSKAIALVALFKYEASFPFYRLAKIQKQFLTPMPASTQFDLMENLANDIVPIWEYFLKLAPDGEQFYIDDTKVKVMSLVLENKDEKTNRGRKFRKGMYTTGIISELNGHQVILYYTGRRYAGENLEILLKNRQSKEIPKVMSDAASTNRIDHEFIQIFCHAHSRRKFVEIEKNFQEESIRVLDWITEIYKNNNHCKENKLTPEERLKYHQEKSGPIMEELKTWCEIVFKEKKVEENSSLGKAINYVLNQWEGLTVFLKKPEIPLDNNILEGNFRTQVLNKKNWLFYKTETGALIGDIICSILKTCVAAKKNPFYYLKWLQDNKEQLKKSPEKFLPWEMPSSLEK